MRNRNANDIVCVTAVVACLMIAGCVSTPTATSDGKPDAVFAVQARAIIDATETVRVNTLRWAGAKVARGQLTAQQGELFVAAGEEVETAENIANAQLAIYLSTGSLDATKALADALKELDKVKAVLATLRTATTGEGE